ncbi:MAG: transporter substrate-binding domain-containing protein [Tepidibacter sp.]|jgi:PAS domain S-box-containing protein|uniref:ATP-binding protein n=1 Tax=Tepidibacter sp. TaxID=2529387 RepID=UPI0025F36028|nr:transporter substrate-binding domain-containing protein [Tepidibacter sp.]MCT4507887.1 transporter substrate-binding domain-containing protein [Tepidibacter sp.]
MKRQIKNILKKYILIIIVLISCTSISSTEEIFKNHEQIKITVIREWKPFSYLDSKGNPKGILIDFWKAWGTINNVKIEFKEPTYWAKSIELIKNGEENIHLGLFYKDDRLEYMDFGSTIIDIMTGIYVQEDINAFNINDIKDLGIAVTEKNYAKYYLEKNYPNIKLLVYKDLKEVMEAVDRGKVKAVCVDYHNNIRNISFYYPELNNFELLQTIYTQPLRVGVKKGEKELLTFINNGIKNMSYGEMEGVKSRWEYMTIYLTKNNIKNYTLIVSTIVIIFLLINTLFLKHRIAQGVKRLLENEESYKKLVKLCPDGIFVHQKGRIVFVNEATIKILGEDDIKNIIGKSVTEFVKDDYKKSVLDNLNKVEKSNITIPAFEEKIVKSNGEIIDVEMSINIITYKGKPAVLTIIRDISQRKEKEKEKQNVLMEKLKYEKLKTEFFSNISHELRTPLNILLGSIQLIDRVSDDNIYQQNEYYKKYSPMMKQNCYRLLRLINNLIDTTKIDAGFLKMNFKNYNIVQVIEDITMSVGEYIKSKDLNIIFDTYTEEKIIKCDADKMERVILNLLSNAIKFTDEGGSIFVNIYEKNETVRISVKDTGIGITKEEQETIFERFRQVHPLLNREKEGSGIGLSLVKSIVEEHKGKIYLNSEYGKGSEFIIEIPDDMKIDQEPILHNEISSNEGKVEKINIEFSDIYS